MSRLYKSRSIVLGDPLEIKSEIVSQQKVDIAQKEINTEMELQADEHNDSLEKEVSEILNSANNESAQIIREAENKSREIYAQAQDKGYKDGFDEGYERGLDEGHEKGRQQGMDTANGMIEEALAIKQKALETKEQIVKEAEAEVIRIVIEIARKVLGDQMRIDRETVLGPVRKALEKCAFSNKVIMKVSPHDFDIIEMSKHKLLTEIEGITQLEIMVEDTLPQGSCLMETDAGYIDSGIEVQLNRIERSFRELLGYE